MITRSRPHAGDAVACIILLFLASASTFAQTRASQVTRSDKTPNEADEITVDGCLYGGQGNFQLVNADDAFELRGDLSALQKYVGDEVKVRGKQEGSDHVLSLIVAGATLVFKAPQIKLSKTITDPSNWHFHANELYGVKFALPVFPENSGGGQSIFPNFRGGNGDDNTGRSIDPARNLSRHQFCRRNLLAISQS